MKKKQTKANLLTNRLNMQMNIWSANDLNGNANADISWGSPHATETELINKIL